MNNTLGDLSNNLFAQLKRLNDVNLEGEKFEEEIVRAKAIGDISKQIISNGNLVLKAMKMIDDRMDADAKLPKMLEGSTEG